MPVQTRSEPTAELAAAVRETLMRFTRRLRRERPDTGLTLTQISALASLFNTGPMTPRQLAEVERVRPPSMTKVLAVLEEQGFVERAPHPTDRRQCILTATSTGAALIRENRRLREAWLARELAQLSDEERATLHAAVDILGRLASR
jgi:DNA-binding MarR family transcriptional regulator